MKEKKKNKKKTRQKRLFLIVYAVCVFVIASFLNFSVFLDDGFVEWLFVSFYFSFIIAIVIAFPTLICYVLLFERDCNN